ncbi:pseudaminic acid synthase [Cellulomonas carbonis]|uniref:N-acetylneuraminate synthase n=1 Tax=Cellulomonas carbonis T26 TaxID=947969 RepID=A0A0A0BMU8_9CELL|nr:pseudaminic acid synthase [Cellulomonas carbonis]KGM09037.1 N-acetylneuraminate synthase [Cellulomonas carbonis T26]GGC11345.1 pseudaminic acid synthase [Cellulomonas carbonis]
MTVTGARRSVRVGDHQVGEDHRPFVVAEMSGNHNGDLGRALAIVDAIAESGAQAVKLQTYTADTITIDADGPAFRVSSGHELWGGKNLHQLYTEAHTPWEWHAPIFERAHQHGLVAFSSPFDDTAVDLLEDLGAPVYKIASLEIGDLALLRRVARTGKPVILSTGAATVTDVDTAVRTIRAEGNDDVVVLACTSSYPASPAESNLRSIPVLRDTFDVVVGLSDHTMGIGVAVAAVAMGATLIEKHVTLARADGGVDSDFSLEPAELAALAAETERGWQALGTVRLEPTPGESESRRLRRSLYVVQDVRAGDAVTPENVRSIRPAGGLEPAYLPVVLGRTFRTDAARGTALTWDLV